MTDKRKDGEAGGRKHYHAVPGKPDVPCCGPCGPILMAECWTCAPRCQVHGVDEPIGDCLYCESGEGSLVLGRDGEWRHLVALPVSEMPLSLCRAAGHDVREIK